MGRPKKQTRPDLSVLERLPEMIAALGYLAGMADKIGSLAPKIGLYRGAVVQMAGQPAQPKPGDLGSSPTAPQAVQLDTPERREWLQQQADVAAAVAEERAKTQPKPLAQLPKRQRDAIAQGFLADSSKRAGLMANFQHDGPPDGETILDTQPIETLSEVT